MYNERNSKVADKVNEIITGPEVSPPRASLHLSRHEGLVAPLTKKHPNCHYPGFRNSTQAVIYDRMNDVREHSRNYLSESDVNLLDLVASDHLRQTLEINPGLVRYKPVDTYNSAL